MFWKINKDSKDGADRQTKNLLIKNMQEFSLYFREKNISKRVLTMTAALLMLVGLLSVRYSGGSVIPTSSTVGNRELPIYCVQTNEPEIALTFDAAWGNEDTREIMEILRKHDVKVTFFMTGGWVDK